MTIMLICYFNFTFWYIFSLFSTQYAFYIAIMTVLCYLREYYVIYYVPFQFTAVHQYYLRCSQIWLFCDKDINLQMGTEQLSVHPYKFGRN